MNNTSLVIVQSIQNLIHGLAEIAVESAKSALSFGMDPKVAMLSFSTKRVF